MASFSQPGTSYNQYFGYGSGTGGMQYDDTQNKWMEGTGSGNQSQQNQQQIYQDQAQAAKYYAAASGYNSGYSNQPYGQQQNYSTGAIESSVGMLGSGNTTSISGKATGTGSTSVCKVGNNVPGTAKNLNISKPKVEFCDFSVTGTGSGDFGGSGTAGFGRSDTGSGTSTAGTFGATGGGDSTMGYNFNPNGMFGNNSADPATMSQMFNGGYTTQNSTQNSAMNNNAGSNVSAQNLGNNANAMGQLNQMFGAGANSGNGTPGDASGGNFGAGFNPFNSGMMSFLQQTILQQANGAAGFGNMGNMWGMTDGDGSYYAAPVDSGSQNLGDGGGGQDGGKKKKWKDSNKQDFYGSRFAQLFTGIPGVMDGQQQGGKVKRLQEGVRINVKGEKVVDVEVPLSLYSRWGQLRKLFSKQDTEVVKHLLTFHDELCEDCLERQQQKKKGSQPQSESQNNDYAEEIYEEQLQETTDLSEEDVILKQVMGFGSFNTTRGAMVEGNQVDLDPDATANIRPLSDCPLEQSTGFIGPKRPHPNGAKESAAKGSKGGSKTEGGTLSEEEKNMMKKLGWSVFNRKKGADSDVDDDEKVDGSAT